MNLWTMITVVTVVGIIGGLINSYLQSKQQSKLDEQELEKRDRHINDLEKRIRVLEEIVTDKQYDLKQKINQL